MSEQLAHITFISAGAGSGKTYRLTEELEKALVQDGIPAAGVIGTTFTVKAASELQDRVRERLITRGYPQLAEQMSQALLGTVHSVCERLLKRFAFELGLSPQLNVVAIEDGNLLFNQALDDVLDATRVRAMNATAYRLDLEDWQKTVKRLADAARSNDIAPDDLPAMGKQSADDLLAFFPAPQTEALTTTLIDTVSQALDAIDTAVDATKGTAAYVQRLRRAIYQLRRFPYEWSLWIGLSKAKATKKSEPIAATVREAAGAFAAHSRYQEDIRTFIEGIYAIAAGTLARFAAIKAERGLIDFNDMEQLALKALDDDNVRAELAAELDLLLVDEFQDTNPMQLALFMKLAELAGKVIFVGDVKQAIYAFRGCDPDLVLQMLDHVLHHGGHQQVLENSWRSRPALVEYTNTVFGEAFRGELLTAQIALKPKRTEQTQAPAVIHWTLAARNKADRAVSLAHGIAELVASGHEIVDADTGEVRPISWGDIAVLAATNNNVEEIAKALRAARVPMKMTLEGLLSVPEVCLAKACLRRLNDASDTLATAEIITLADCAEPEDWLAERLRWLKGNNKSHDWAVASHPVLEKIQTLRRQTTTQSPVEIVARVLNYVGIREAVTAWGPDEIKAAQRQRNLDAFLHLAVQYEDHAQAQQEAATLTGFLFWLENPRSPELDLQPVVTTGDAVHVLTYHRSKGLEWPVVVATDFDYCWRPRLWDVRVEPTGAAFNVEQPLSGRAIRYWPSVFGGNTTGIDVLDTIVTSDEGLRCQAKNASENRRLAYVGLTRARDTLVLAVQKSKKADAWMHDFNGEHLLPDENGLTLPSGMNVPCTSSTLAEDGPSGTPLMFTPQWFQQRAPTVEPSRETLSPSQAEPVEGTTIAEIVDLGERIPIQGDDMTAIGNALHDVMAAELINPDRGDAVERARQILESYGAETYLAAADADLAAKRFRVWVLERFKPKRILPEYPISHRLATGQLTKGWIDVLLETEEGWVIIDHKSSPRPRSELEREVTDYSGQLDAYTQALCDASEKVVGRWIHFPISAGVVLVN